MTKRVIDEMTKYKLLVTLVPLSKTNNGGNNITAGQ